MAWLVVSGHLQGPARALGVADVVETAPAPLDPLQLAEPCLFHVSATNYQIFIINSL